MANSNMYVGFRYPSEIIRHLVWLYFRFSLSFRDINEFRLVTHKEKQQCCRRRQIDPCAGILLTQHKTLQTVAYARFAPNFGGSVKIGRLGQKRIGVNRQSAARSGLPATVFSDRRSTAGELAKASAERQQAMMRRVPRVQLEMRGIVDSCEPETIAKNEISVAVCHK